MNREYHTWQSDQLGREMEMLVFGHAGARVLIFPTRDGRFHEYEDLRMVEAIRPKIEAGLLQLWCVDSVDHESFYCFWKQPQDRIQRHIEFEDYILDEVLPFMDERNDHPVTVAHGCSLGAFHASNIAFRHPHRFQKLAAFSGRYDLTLSVENFEDRFEGFYNEDIYFHTPSHYLPNLEDDAILERIRQMDITLVIGEEDPFLPNNHELSQMLWHKEIPHSFHVWRERAHRGYYWRRMAPLYL